MSEPPAKKRKVQNNSSDLVYFPPDLWSIVGGYTNASNIERLSRSDDVYITRAMTPLLECKNLIRTGSECFTERPIGDTKKTHRVTCEKECDAFKRQYIKAVLILAQDIMRNPHEYSLLTNGAHKEFGLVSLYVSTPQGPVRYNAQSNQWISEPYPSFHVPISISQLADTIVDQGKIILNLDFDLQGDDGPWDDFSIVKTIGGHDFGIAPIFDHLRAEQGLDSSISVEQNLAGPERVRMSPPFERYVFENDWYEYR